MKRKLQSLHSHLEGWGHPDPTRISEPHYEQGLDISGKDLRDGSKAIGLFNENDLEQEVSID